ncbi:unnamed protein product [Rhizophagus irregularis]|uniref:Uncharacterized protein n=2 Tax=Rhizophagus irregularis TaxID=588596 RepID=A0A916EDE8_9GLOM|nr:hypothetical protein RirG_120090 [Rhizophagus irregularis DAOM 197198w]CAB4390116.1 unnamed protein product [Rhizophagus irregularis]GET60096.1 hypothetical protein GLOIN_2v1673735 [Rhizophagus irregularis DAOM 181602=DAOM 197198]CAB4420842.1 unnamed protein product [Rhizophagus irregularis]CAB4421565.1 unnamed protein product [Rhizophagus irregularis]
MVSLSSGEFQSRVTNNSGKMRPPPYPTNIMFYVFWFLIIFIGWHYFMITGCGRGGGNSGGSIQEKQLVIWVKHSQHADPVKVYVSYNADIADVKKVVRQELQPALDKESLGRVLLLSPELGRLSPPTLIRKVDLGKNDNLIVFVDNLESRLFLKTLTTDRLPLQVNAPLCLKTDEAYIVVAKILMGSYSQQDITALKNSLCESSIESWSSRYSYAGRE